MSKYLIIVLCLAISLGSCGKKEKLDPLPYAGKTKSSDKPLAYNPGVSPYKRTAKKPTNNSTEKSYRDITKADLSQSLDPPDMELDDNIEEQVAKPVINIEVKTAKNDVEEINEDPNPIIEARPAMKINIISINPNNIATDSYTRNSTPQNVMAPQPQPAANNKKENIKAPAPAPLTDTQHIQALIKSNEKQLKKTPNDKATQHQLVMLYLLNDELDKALQLLQKKKPTLEAANNLILALTLFKEGETQEGLAVLNDFTMRLKQEMPLTLKKAVLADLNDFPLQAQYVGKYTPRFSSQFNAGEMVQIYTELDNFSSVYNDKDKHYNISVNISAELYDMLGTKINWIPYEESIGNYEITVRSQIKELCPSTRFRMPNDIATGDYILKIIVKDNYKLQKKAATKSIKISIKNF